MAKLDLNQSPSPSLDSETNTEVIKQKTIQSIVVLTGRTFVLQIVSLLAIFFLTVFLTPQEYGTFFVVSAVVSFFAYFSDIGFAAALIQKKEQLTKHDLATTFTIQQILVLLMVLLIFLATPFIQIWFKLSHESIYLLWSLAFSLVLSSLKTIPSVLLERKLDFNKVVIPQIMESLIFNIVAVFLAWNGFGIMSFVYAVIARGISGFILIYILQPWVPSISFSKDSFKTLLRFGLPYQLNIFLAVAKDDGMTIFLGGILGPANMGLLGWAQKWASAPLRFFMDQVIKVTFPSFSRLQDNREELSKAVSRSIFFICSFVFPALVALVIVAPILIQIIPKYNKWEGALLALTLISINSAWAAVTTPLTNTLNAIGKISVTFKLMIMWTILTWLLLPILASQYGVNGAALGFTILGFSSVVAIVIALKIISINLFDSVLKPLSASFLMAIIMYVIREISAISLESVILITIVGVFVYVMAIYILVGPGILIDLKKIINAVLNKENVKFTT